MLVELYLTRDTNTDGGAAPCHSDFAEVLSQNLTDPSLKYPIAYSTRVTPYMEPLLFEREQAFNDRLLIRQPLRTSVLSDHIFRRQHLRILRLALHTSVASLARWRTTSCAVWLRNPPVCPRKRLASCQHVSPSFPDSQFAARDTTSNKGIIHLGNLVQRSEPCR